MLNNFFTKHSSFVSVPLRIALGGIFVFHGYSNLANGTFYYSEFVLAFGLLLSGLSILMGFFTRMAAFSIIVVFVLIGLLSKVTGSPSGPDFTFEQEILTLAATMTLIFTGSGSFSLERYLNLR